MSAVNRPVLTILTAGAAACLAAGCSSLDTDAVATVGDATMSEEQITEIVPLVGGADAIAPADQATADRNAISLWLEAQVFTQSFASDGELDQAAIDQSAEALDAQFGEQFSELSEDTRTLLSEYVTVINQLPTMPRPDDAEVRAWFDDGPERTGIACVSHILVESNDDAQAIVDELADATDQADAFAAIAAERSIDPGSGSVGGFLSCDTTANLSQQFVVPFAEAAVAAEPGVPTEPVESDFGFHVIRLLTYDEAAGQLEPFYAQGYVQARLAIDDADITVGSRYGVVDGVDVRPAG